MARKVVVITGASGGIGRATARLFGREGARVALLARESDGLSAAAREVERGGGEALPIAVDVADAKQVERAAAKIESKWGTIDVWINNAMTAVFAPFKEMDADEFRRVTEVTYLGYVHGTMSALRRMLPRNKGVIVQVGSALAYRSIPLQSAYCGAKHAIVGFTDSIRCELHHDKSNVKITAVHMPAVNTPQFDWVRSKMPNQPRPVAPVYEPEMAAKAILQAAKNPKREYWIGWSTVAAIVGQMFIPGLLDMYLGKTGYKAQQTEERKRGPREEDLWEPVKKDHGARGRFTKEASDETSEFWFAKHGTQLVSLFTAGAAFWKAVQSSK